MSNIKNYQIKPFSLNQKVLGYDNSQTLSVTMKEIVDNINQGEPYQELLDLLNSLNNAIYVYPTYGVAKSEDLPIDAIVILLGNPDELDGNGGIFIVKDTELVNNTLPLDNGRFLNDALLTPRLKDAEQLGSVTLASNVYTFTPDSGLFRPLENGLVIKFPLPATANTGAVDINYNGTSSDATWIDSTQFTSGDLDDTYNKQIVSFVYQGGAWRCLSDISGSNSNGSWTKRADGKVEGEHSFSFGSTWNSYGAIYQTSDGVWTYPKPVISALDVDLTGACDGAPSVLVGGDPLSTTQAQFRMVSGVTSIGLPRAVSVGVRGRWY